MKSLAIMAGFLPFLAVSSLASQCEQSFEAPVIQSYLPEVDCSGHHIKNALRSQVHCKPRPQVVQLPWPNNTDLQQMTPTHVEVARCGGGCHHLRQSCIARRTRMKIIPVMVAKCGISVGLCDKECASVEVEEHLECGCECAVKKEDCTLDQEFRKDLCTCQCRDREAVRTCQESGRVWDRQSCSCQCPMVSSGDCTAGLAFDNVTCTCIPILGFELNTIELKEEKQVRRKENFFLSWELIIIGVLLSTILLLIIIVLCLTCMHHSLKRKMRTSHVLYPSTVTKNLYVPYSDPCQDLNMSRKVKEIKAQSSDEEMSDRHTDSSMCCDSVSDTSTEICRKDTGLPELGSQRKNSISRQVYNYQDRQTDHLSGFMRHNRADSGSCLSDDSSGTTVIANTGYHRVPQPGPNQDTGYHRVTQPGPNQDSEYHRAPQNSSNQVQIVYRTGERTMELNCHLMGDNGEMEKLMEKKNLGNMC